MPVNNAHKLKAFMKKHDLTEKDVAEILNLKPSTKRYWRGHATIRRMLNDKDHNGMIGWDNVAVLLDSWEKKNKSK